MRRSSAKYFLSLVAVGGLLLWLSNDRAPQLSDVADEPETVTHATASATAVEQPTSVQAARVLQVIDGDTIEVELQGVRERVRYIGIDTPEMSYRETAADCFAVEATLANEALVAGKEVQLISDVSDKDEYGRLLRYVMVEEVDVGAELVRQGFARSVRILPDIDRFMIYRKLEEVARAAKIGQWGEVCQRRILAFLL